MWGMNSAQYKSISVWIIKIGLFIVPFIPLYVAKSLFFPYITGKAFIFRIVVEIIFAVWIWLALVYKEYRPRKTALLWAVSALLGVIILATIFSVNPVKSIWSNFERMEGLIAHLHIFAYFLVLSHVFTKKDWFIFLNLFMVSGLIENGYALSQRLGYLASPQGGFRVDGTIGNPTYLGAYLIFILAFSALLWLEVKDKRAKYFYAFSALWTLTTLYFTASRGPVLGLLIGVGAVTVLYLIATRKKAVLLSLVALLVIPIGLWMLRDASFIKGSPALSRLTSLSFGERTIVGRFDIWGLSWQGVQDKPLIGWGLENYGAVFAKYYNPNLWWQEPWFDRAHNIIFDWLIHAGIVGLVSYLSIFVTALYLLWKGYERKNISFEVGMVLFALLISYFFQNLFVFDNLATYIGFFTILAFIHASMLGEERLMEAPIRHAPSVRLGTSHGKQGGMGSSPLVPIFLIVPLCLTIYFINAQPFLVNRSLLATFVNGKHPEDKFKDFEKALSYNHPLGRQEISEHLINFSLRAGGEQSLTPEFRDTVIRRAITEGQNSVVRDSLDPRPYLFLGILYGKIGLRDEAIATLEKGRLLSPAKPGIYFEIADVYIQKGEIQKAVDILEYTFYNNTAEDQQTRLNLAGAYILNNQQVKADEIIIDYYGTTEAPDRLLLGIYSRAKDYERLAGIWRGFVKFYPINIEYRQGLIGAYLLLGDKMKALEAAQDAIEAIPSFKEEGERTIKEILAS
ncbi:MAG: O-antigen ligase family protein [bacterium]|nr:O-antigen ligase family protein [bacterium]